MPVVYRIEHPESGKGPFHHDDDETTEFNDRPEWRKYPLPISDGLRGHFDSKKHYCGTPTFEAVFDWFGHVMDILRDRGFVLRIYDAEWVKEGLSSTQVIFEKDTAKVVDELTL